MRWVFRHGTGSIVFDKAFDFTANDDSLAVTLNVPVASSAPAPPAASQYLMLNHLSGVGSGLFASTSLPAGFNGFPTYTSGGMSVGVP